MKNFGACLRFRFLQTRAGADESLETKHRGDRNIASRCFQSVVYLFFAFAATTFELRTLASEVAVRETAFSDLADGSETSERVEEVEKCCVSRPKLADERIGRRFE